jgi:hypothetical protein
MELTEILPGAMLLLACFALGLVSAVRASFAIGGLTVNRKRHLEMLLEFRWAFVFMSLARFVNSGELRLAFSSPAGFFRDILANVSSAGP